MAFEKIGSFLNSSRRVLTVSKKPGWDEFKVMAKVTAIGIAVIGVVGYAVYLIFSLLNIS